jgi:hypothetical protein
MIRVTIQNVPDAGEPEVIGYAEIREDGTGTIDRGNYTFVLKARRNRTIAEGRIEDFPHQRLLPWDLLNRILDMARPKRW